MSVFLREQKLRLRRMELAREETELEIARKEEQIATMQSSIQQSTQAIEALKVEIQKIELGG
jgi:fatty acid-binding protein DegV